jgi:hypothetical protein
MYLSRCVAFLLLVTGIWVLLLSGCSTGVRPAAPVDTRLQDQAQSLEAAGDYQAAASLYLEAAERSDSPLKEDYRLLAVDSLIRGSDFDDAEAILDKLSPSELPEPQRQHYDVNRAQLAIAAQHTDEVLEILQRPPASGPYAAEYRRLRAEALKLNADYLASAREYIAREAFLEYPEQRLKNQLATWEALSGLSDSELQQSRTAPPPDTLSGWLELVELTRLYLQQPDALAGVIPHWQARYPGHPANEVFLGELLNTMQMAGQPPEQVALLLPLSGTLSGAATAIRDGILAAWYDTSDGIRRPSIHLYDVGTDPTSVMDAYQQAVTDGARFIIGPLRKEAVQVLMQQEQLPVQVLVLNQIETEGPLNASVYQFGLAPEDEAREVAQRAMRDGHTRTISLIPQGDWGERVYAAFVDEWVKLGGFVLDHQTYDPAQADHGKLLSTTLNLDASKARKQRLVQLLGQQLEFEPRRRQDVDFFFLLATPKQARLIRPQLSFYRASRVPVYSTSHVYSGQTDESRDIDMNGIVFCDMPWSLDNNGNWQHLRQTIDEHWPENAARYSRFYALGIDAYRITPYLGQQMSGIFGSYQGVTGNLSLDSRQRIHRTLRWAQFRNGIPTLLQPSEETVTETVLETGATPP